MEESVEGERGGQRRGRGVRGGQGGGGGEGRGEANSDHAQLQVCTTQTIPNAHLVGYNHRDGHSHGCSIHRLG